MQRSFELSAQRAQLAEAGIQGLEGRLEDLQRQVREQAEGGGSGRGGEALSQELAELRGQIEVLQFDITGLRADFDQYQIDQERRSLHAEMRLSQLEAMLGATPPAPPQLGLDGEASIVQADPSQPTPVVDSPAAAMTYEQRLGLAETRMAEGSQSAARAILESLLRGEEMHPREAEARYRLAETYFNEGRWKEAANEFHAVSDAFENSPWAPWAMLRTGECFDGMGRRDAAKTFYDGVVRNFPGSDAAAEASKHL